MGWIVLIITSTGQGRVESKAEGKRMLHMPAGSLFFAIQALYAAAARKVNGRDILMYTRLF
jgi:hypothetical protein